MDLEDITVYLLSRGLKEDEVVSLITLILTLRKGLNVEKALRIAKAAYEDFTSVRRNAGSYAVKPLGAKAGESGLGSRGLGDFTVHEVLTSLSREGDAAVLGDLVLAVDGFHSRLNAVPLLMGFHATRAAARDVMVTGALPLATLIDVHVADDTDVAYVLDVTVGSAVAGELLNAPLVGGSTLRIGGDAVLGERITGGSFVVGKRVRAWSRFNVERGDVLYATVGKGGGTVVAFALSHGFTELIDLTLNVDFYAEIKTAMEKECVKGAFDWTNGGILLDAFEISNKKKLKIELNDNVYKAVHPLLLKRLEEAGVEPLSVSTDSIVFIAKEGCDLPFIEIGRVEEGEGIYLNGKRLLPGFREAPYTHLKKAVEDIEKKLDPSELRDYVTKRYEWFKKKVKRPW